MSPEYKQLTCNTCDRPLHVGDRNEICGECLHDLRTKSQSLEAGTMGSQDMHEYNLSFGESV